MAIKCIDNINEHLEVLSNYFRAFYEKEPWGDYKGCDNCYASLTVTEAPRFGKNEIFCPQCEQKLVPFWNPSRCRSALEKTNLSIGYFEEEELKGWIISKPVSDQVIAINFIGLDNKFRRNKSKIILTAEAIIVLSSLYLMGRVKNLNQWGYNRLMNSSIISLQLYCFFENEARKQGYTSIQTTTHKTAKNIYKALYTVGFRLRQKNLPHDRVLFEKIII